MRVRYSNVLCAVDFSPESVRALSFAAEIARRYGGKVLACHVVDASPALLLEVSAFAYRATHEKLHSQAREEIDRLMAGRDVPWEPVVIDGMASLEIPRIAVESGADLVVAGTHGRSGVKRLLLGSVAERLQKVVPCPLLVVRAADSAGGPAVEGDRCFRRILVGCDFSSDSKLAVQHAFSLAQEFQAEVQLVHVMETTYYEQVAAVPSTLSLQMRSAVRDAVEKDLASLAGPDERAWCDVKTSLRTGRPDEEIVQNAREWGADLIVLGIRGHSLLDELFVGSTAERVSRKAPCPVLTVQGKARE